MRYHYSYGDGIFSYQTTEVKESPKNEKVVTFKLEDYFVFLDKVIAANRVLSEKREEEIAFNKTDEQVERELEGTGYIRDAFRKRIAELVINHEPYTHVETKRFLGIKIGETVTTKTYGEWERTPNPHPYHWNDDTPYAKFDKIIELITEERDAEAKMRLPRLVMDYGSYANAARHLFELHYNRKPENLYEVVIFIGECHGYWNFYDRMDLYENKYPAIIKRFTKLKNRVKVSGKSEISIPFSEYKKQADLLNTEE